MTVSEIAAQMGVTPETLVWEVCKHQTDMATFAEWHLLLYQLSVW